MTTPLTKIGSSPFVFNCHYLFFF